MKRVLSIVLLCCMAFAACGKEQNISLAEPAGSIDNYIMYDEDIAQTVRRADSDYLYAFFGRKEGEMEDKNRVIYLNKDNEIEKEFYLEPVEEGIKLNLVRFRFGRDYLMLTDGQYSGVTSDGQVHGLAVVDSGGRTVCSYEARDPYNFAGVDMYTRLNRFTSRWCEKDSDTFIIATYLALYECNMKDGTLTQILSLDDIVEDFDAEETLAGKKHSDLFNINYGFGKLFWSDEQGLVFTVCDSFDTNGRCTLYSFKDGVVTQLSEKDSAGIGLYVPYYNEQSGNLVRLDEKTRTYMINEQPYPEYTTFVQQMYYFDPERPVLLGTDYSDTKTTVSYYDSTSGRHYNVAINKADATAGGLFHNEVWHACGNYIYLSAANAELCYRYNVETGKGRFVASPMEDKSLMPGYRIRRLKEVTKENTLIYKVRIYKENTI